LRLSSTRSNRTFGTATRAWIDGEWWRIVSPNSSGDMLVFSLG
jgi:hypothetical protein